jgi:hypothetical protein
MKAGDETCTSNASDAASVGTDRKSNDNRPAAIQDPAAQTT